MAEVLRKSDSPNILDETRGAAAPQPQPQPTENEADGGEREPEVTLGEEIRARIPNVHKGDVGRPGTNEEIFQGSKMKELE
jgi:hypothetical protein